MVRVPKDVSVAERARWLAELADALEDAHQVATEIGLAHLQHPDAVELRGRLAAARAQVQALRLSRPDDRSGQVDPKWGNSVWPNIAAGTER